jgi:hypothetical protein
MRVSRRRLARTAYGRDKSPLREGREREREGGETLILSVLYLSLPLHHPFAPTPGCCSTCCPQDAGLSPPLILRVPPSTEARYSPVFGTPASADPPSLTLPGSPHSSHIPPECFLPQRLFPLSMGHRQRKESYSVPCDSVVKDLLSRACLRKAFRGPGAVSRVPGADRPPCVLSDPCVFCVRIFFLLSILFHHPGLNGYPLRRVFA